MNFVTLDFAVFFLVVLAAGWAVQDRPRAGKAVLLCANLFFYAWAGWVFVPLLLTVATLNWATVRLIAMPGGGRIGEDEPRRDGCRRWILAVDVGLHVALLAFFKYYEFFVLNLEALFRLAGFEAPHLPMADILFPVGLSFYTFQGLSYAVDRYRRRRDGGEGAKPESFGRVLLFVSFFPTVMAGPILRESQFFPQLDRPVRDAAALPEGFALLLSGLFKKVVLASYLSEHVVRDVFQAPELYSSWAVLAAVYGYAMQIFCDFSGYSDLAAGVGRLMGFRIPQNFNSPYLALNLRDFWRRWHITLSLWLRDYLYIPLGGSRRGSRTLNLLVTMGLGGLWHGSHVRFLAWGLLHGLGLAAVHVFEAFTRRPGAPAAVGRWFAARPGKCLAWLLTFHTVALLWIFFRAEDMDRALEIFRRLFCFGQPGDGFPALAIPAILAAFAVQLWGGRLFVAFAGVQARLPWALQSVTAALAAGCILKMGPDGVMPFIYFQF